MNLCRADEIRLKAFQESVMSLNRRYTAGTSAGQPGQATTKSVCHLIRYREVSPKTRSVVPGDGELTYVARLGTDSISFVHNHSSSLGSHAVVELLDAQHAAVARFLVKLGTSKPAVRGLYLIDSTILTTVPTKPDGVVFNKGYFT